MIINNFENNRLTVSFNDHSGAPLSGAQGSPGCLALPSDLFASIIKKSHRFGLSVFIAGRYSTLEESAKMKKELVIFQGKERMFNLKKARETQQRLSSLISLNFSGEEITRIGAVDCSYDFGRQRIAAVVVVFEIASLRLIEEVESQDKIPLPYIPGFLNFREAPVILKAWRKLAHRPDVLLVDGNGIAHPRRMGLASYVGLLLDQPTIGCAKSPFFPYEPPEKERGSISPYFNDRGEQVGLCVRTRTGIKPVFVSPGHKMDIPTAGRIVLNLAKYRLPEPLRVAHQQAQKIFKKK
jgi:deoxyribonuclease V